MAITSEDLDSIAALFTRAMAPDKSAATTNRYPVDAPGYALAISPFEQLSGEAGSGSYIATIPSAANMPRLSLDAFGNECFAFDSSFSVSAEPEYSGFIAVNFFYYRIPTPGGV